MSFLSKSNQPADNNSLSQKTPFFNPKKEHEANNNIINSPVKFVPKRNKPSDPLSGSKYSYESSCNTPLSDTLSKFPNSVEIAKKDFGKGVYKFSSENFDKQVTATSARKVPRLSDSPSIESKTVKKNSKIDIRPPSDNNNSNGSAPRFVKDREKLKQHNNDQLMHPSQTQIHQFRKGVPQEEKAYSTAKDKVPAAWVKPCSRKPIGSHSFTKIKILGKGKYGQVYLAREKNTGFICALKVVAKRLLMEEQITVQFIRELKIQMYLKHPNIIKMYSYFHDKDYIYIILEVGTGGELYSHLKKTQQMPESKVASIMRQLCDAVLYLHTSNIIHRDIKPQNIVLHDGIVKLCDFGWSVRCDNKLRTTFCGTPLYVCPEILRGRDYDERIDVWSLGVIMYEMIVGESPFKITKEEELIKIVKDKVQIPSYVFVSKEARDYMDKCLCKNPDERANIRDLINHEFFAKYPDKKLKINV